MEYRYLSWVVREGTWVVVVERLRSVFTNKSYCTLGVRRSLLRVLWKVLGDTPIRVIQQ